VHRIPEPVFLESVYQIELEHELTLRGVPSEHTKQLALMPIFGTCSQQHRCTVWTGVVTGRDKSAEIRLIHCL